jgi:hypothetical protein
MKYRLSDEVLAAFAQSVQLAMLTATDITDHLRLIEVEPSLSTPDAPPATLDLTSECRERLKKNVEDLQNRALELASTRHQKI